ncbi:MAG TPA: cyclase family protein [Thermoanaerobaculia bacterium]|nr:cyclase family protein [Thermoanaerobaculia bacterium]
MTRLIDLSHTIRDALVTYPGLPAPRVTEFLSREDSRGRYAPGVEFHIGRIEMVANTGTYIDAPFHRYEGGGSVADLALERIAGLEGVVITAGDRPRITEAEVGAIDARGKAVLIRTGCDRDFGTPAYFERNPFLTEEGAVALIAGGAVLVGIDAVNIDDMTDLRRPAHSALLEAGIPIVEHLAALDALPSRGFRFFAVPPKVASMGSFPVRAFAIID